MKKITKIVFLIILVAVLLTCGYFVKKNLYREVFRTSQSMPSPNLVGGCGSVAAPYRAECCDSWAEENNITSRPCVGNWNVEDNICKWVCEQNQNPVKKINTQVNNDSKSGNDSVIPRDVCGLDNNGKLVCS